MSDPFDPEVQDHALALRMGELAAQPKRRRSGTIRQLPSGRWLAILRKSGHQQSATFEHRETAERFLRVAESHLPDRISETSMDYLRGLDGWSAHFRRRRPVSQSTRLELERRFRGTCMLCGRLLDSEAPFAADHIVAVGLGGTDEELNLWPAHQACNASRKDKPVRLWLHEHELGHGRLSGCCAWDAFGPVDASIAPADPEAARLRDDAILVAEALWRLRTGIPTN